MECIYVHICIFIICCSPVKQYCQCNDQVQNHNIGVLVISFSDTKQGRKIKKITLIIF